MEIKEVWTEFKDRVNNPLFGSFVLSWLACNWWLPVMLFFYKHEDLIKTKTTYIDVIQRRADRWHMFFIPFSIAVAYAILSPLARYVVKRYTAYIDRSTEETIDTDAGKKMVPVGDLMIRRRELRTLEADLQQLVLTERETSDKNEDLEQQNAALKAEVTRIEAHNINMVETLKATHNSELETLVDRYRTRIVGVLKDETYILNEISKKIELIKNQNPERYGTDLDYNLESIEQHIRDRISSRPEILREDL